MLMTVKNIKKVEVQVKKIHWNLKQLKTKNIIKPIDLTLQLTIISKDKTIVILNISIKVRNIKKLENLMSK